MGFFRSDGRLNIDVYDGNQSSSAVAFDCNELCACDFRTCKNLHLKSIDPKRVEVFRKRELLNGWGLRSATNISRGEFVLPMIGEVIALKSGTTVFGDYMTKISNFGGVSYFLNQSECANASRFVNHSCGHNLVPVRIVRTHDDFRIPSIALFAIRDIEKGQELTMNYGDQYWARRGAKKYCLCRSENCRYDKHEKCELIAKELEKPAAAFYRDEKENNLVT